MYPAPWQIILVLLIALLLFGGRGRISSIMGDVAKGIKSFRKGLTEEEKTLSEENKDEDDQSKAAMTSEAPDKSKDPEKTAS